MIITNSQLRKVINEELQIVLVEQRMELWEQRTTRELDKLLSEIDLKGVASAALEKINNFVHTAGVKAWQFMQKGKEAAMKGIKFLSGILQKIQSFCAKRPRVCGAAKVFLTVMIMAGVVVATAGAAQAAEGGFVDPAVLDQIIGGAKVAMDPLAQNPGGAGGFVSYHEQIDEYVRVLNELRNIPVDAQARDLSKGAQKVLSIGLETLNATDEIVGGSGVDLLQKFGANANRAAQEALDAVMEAAVSGNMPLGTGPK
tara:strand:- start:3282 stop:4052 length:771 start_codon:yes stop_codon:yes gene_type:complete